MLCKHFHRAQGGQCAVLQNAKTRLQKRKMAIFKQGRQKSYKSAHHTSRERERERERERVAITSSRRVFLQSEQLGINSDRRLCHR